MVYTVFYPKNFHALWKCRWYWSDNSCRHIFLKHYFFCSLWSKTHEKYCGFDINLQKDDKSMLKEEIIIEEAQLHPREQYEIKNEARNSKTPKMKSQKAKRKVNAKRKVDRKIKK